MYRYEISDKDNRTLLRIAWALDLEVKAALPRIFEEVVGAIDPSRVCSKCKDRVCEHGKPCVFLKAKVIKGPGNISIPVKEDEDE